jgi:hypothetical protein
MHAPPFPLLPLHVDDTTCVFGGGMQSEVTQHVLVEMHELVWAQTRFPEPHRQVPFGAPTQVWPNTEHSLSPQQLLLEMQVVLDEHRCCPEPHAQLPPTPLQFCPPVQSAVVQQVPLSMHTFKLPTGLHTRWFTGQVQVPALQIWPLTTALHSPSVQQFALGMQLVPHTFWFAGHEQLPPGPLQVCPAMLLQSGTVEQQLVARMHCENVPGMTHDLKPDRQVQLAPDDGQTWPAIAMQSLLLQQVPSGMQAAFCWHECCPVGHTQLPLALQNCPE